MTQRPCASGSTPTSLLDRRLDWLDQLEEGVRPYVTGPDPPMVGQVILLLLERGRALFGPDVVVHVEALQADLLALIGASRRTKVERLHEVPPVVETYEAIGVEEALRRELDVEIRIHERVAAIRSAAALHVRVGQRLSPPRAAWNLRGLLRRRPRS